MKTAYRIVFLAAIAFGCVVVARMRRESESQRKYISKLQAENKGLRTELVGFQNKLESAIRDKNFTNADNSSSGSSSPVPLPRSSADSPIERVGHLRNYLLLHPEKGIPELKLLKDEDWIHAVADIPLDSEAHERRALALVRQYAKIKFVDQFATALSAYATANNGQTPTDPRLLSPYLPDQSDATVLQRYAPVARGADLPPQVSGETWLFAENPVDDWYDSHFYLSSNGAYGVGNPSPGQSIEDAIAAYGRITGQKPSDSAQVIPYLKQNLDPALVGAIFGSLQPTETASK